MDPVKQWLNACAALAQKLGLQYVLVGAVDPRTGAVTVLNSGDEKGREALRGAVAEKFGFADEAMTGWGD